MQLSTQLVSAGVTAAMLVAVVAAIVGVRDWRHEATVPGGGKESLGDRAYGLLSRGANSQTGWILGFLALSFALGGTVVVFLAGGPMSAAAGMAGTALGALVLFGFLAVGTYRTVRFRGRSSAGAAAVTAWTVGTLGVLAVVVDLLLG